MAWPFVWTIEIVGYFTVCISVFVGAAFSRDEPLIADDFAAESRSYTLL